MMRNGRGATCSELVKNHSFLEWSYYLAGFYDFFLRRLVLKEAPFTSLTSSFSSGLLHSEWLLLLSSEVIMLFSMTICSSYSLGMVTGK